MGVSSGPMARALRISAALGLALAGCLAEFLPTLEDAVGRWSQDGESPAHTPVAISGVLHELVVLAMRGAGLSWEERFTVARRAASMAERTLPFREDDERAAFTSRFGDLLRRLDTVAAREHHALPFDDPTPAEDFASRLLDPNHAAAPTQEPDAIDRFTDMVGEHELLGVSADTVATIRAQVSPHAWGRLVFGMTSWAMASQDESPDPDALVRTARYAASLGTDPVFAGPFAPRLDATIHGMLSWASAAAIHHQIPGDIYDNHDELASSLLLTLKLGEAWQWLGLPRERRLAGGDEGIQSLPDVWSAALLTGAAVGADHSGAVPRDWTRFYTELARFVANDERAILDIAEPQRSALVDIISSVVALPHEDEGLRSELHGALAELAPGSSVNQVSEPSPAYNEIEPSAPTTADEGDPWLRVQAVIDEHWTPVDEENSLATTWKAVEEMERALDAIPPESRTTAYYSTAVLFARNKTPPYWQPSKRPWRPIGSRATLRGLTIPGASKAPGSKWLMAILLLRLVVVHQYLGDLGPTELDRQIFSIREHLPDFGAR